MKNQIDMERAKVDHEYLRNIIKSDNSLTEDEINQLKLYDVKWWRENDPWCGNTQKTGQATAKPHELYRPGWSGFFFNISEFFRVKKM